MGDRQRPLPLTETLVFDIVEYLLTHNGYGYSTEISSYMDGVLTFSN